MIFAKIFVAATCRKKSHLTEFVRLVAATEKIFTKNSPVRTKALVPAMRRRNLLLQLLARPAHKE